MSKIWLHLIFIFLICALVYLTFYPLLSFSLLKDEWPGYWGTKNALLDFTFCQQTHCLNHPFSFIEFFITSKIFSPYHAIWFHIGFLLRILLSFTTGLLTTKITKNQQAGLIAVLLSSLTLLGSETLEFAGSHSIAVIGICSNLSAYHFLRYQETYQKKSALRSIIFFVLSLIADPWRAFPILGIYIYLFNTNTPNSSRHISKKFLHSGITVLLGIFVMLLYVYWDFISQSHLFHTFFSDPGKIINPLKYFNLIGTLGVITAGWLIPTVDGGGPLINRYILYVFGFVTLIVGIYAIFRSSKNKSLTEKIVGFFILWLVIFYIPNWLYNPRLLAGSERGYITTSTIGSIGLLSYVLVHFTKPVLSIVFIIVFIFYNAFLTQTLIRAKLPYRDRALMIESWNIIDRSIPDTKQQIILNLTGDDPYKTNIFSFNAPYPFIIKRNITNPKSAPIVTESVHHVRDLLCLGSYTELKNVTRNDYQITEVFAFHIDSNKRVSVQTEEFRRKVANEARNIGCTL